jgi:hypothetical protein
MKQILQTLCMTTSINFEQFESINLDLTFEELEIFYEIINERIQEELLKKMEANLYKMENGILREKTDDELLDEYADEYYRTHQFDDIAE